MKYYFYLIALTLLSFQSCESSDPNLNSKGKDVLQANQIFADKIDLKYHDTVYVPIYSDIYAGSQYVTFNLTATLSIRNTSLKDSIYINDIDYYNTDGDLVKHFLDKTLVLKPMQSIEYVIEEADKSGGTGANFIVNWGGMKKDLKPIIQGVMISIHRQQGISFVTEGVSLTN